MGRLPLVLIWKGHIIMQEAALSPLAVWQNFYVIMGTAAATLTGLMFVVITLLAGVRQRLSTSDEGIAAFNTPNVVHFCAALLIAAIHTAPWQVLWQTSILLGLCGLAGMMYAVIVLRRALRHMDYQPVLEDWIYHVIFPLFAYTTLVVAAILLPIQAAPALFISAGTTVLLLFIGVHNAWDNVTYMVTEFSQQNSKD